MKLDKFYNLDGCLSEDKLFELLNQMKDEEKIQYKSLDAWTVQIIDHDLTMDEEIDFISKLTELCVYPDESYDQDFWGVDYDDFD